MLGDNSLGADEIDCAVPDVIGIYDDHGPMSALIHAAGVVHSNDVAQSCGRDGLFQDRMNFIRSRERARFAARADEDVMAVLSHEANKISRKR